ncbi:hypothetical protein [Bacillus solimangrovi]|uniref:Uncharacterized protein n=1 Tax=Bacillus solimangrovi TaxID=1305675 RepID=A0A1E5LEF2_9BACI|nr:hypothetical protein [Bacillus solimangrovi]OEH92446.1 hypothetical protein BFG57_15810 [Bacillus solimangrovi]
MKVDTLNVKYIIDEKTTVIPTKMFYEIVAEDEFQTIHFEVQLNNHQIKSKLSNSVEYAIKYFQTELPDNIRIACCQSCQHGNFNPFGDLENEIFCLKDKTLLNRDRVVNIFSEQDDSFDTRSRKLLDYCKDYQSICESEKYTYNDWV